MSAADVLTSLESQHSDTPANPEPAIVEVEAATSIQNSAEQPHVEIIETVARNMLDTQRALQEEQSRGVELEKILASKAVREKELEAALEEERRRAVAREKAVEEARLKVNEQKRAAREATAALEEAKLSATSVARILDDHMAKKASLEAALEAEKSKRSGGEEAIAALEKRVQEQRRAAQEATTALEAAVEMRRATEEERNRIAAKAQELAQALEAEKEKADDAGHDVAAREALAEEARQAALEARQALDASLKEKAGLQDRLEEAECEIARKSAEIERIKSDYAKDLQRQKKSSEIELEEERRRNALELETMRKNAQETAEALRTAKAEQEMAAADATQEGAVALADLIDQTKSALTGYESLISEIKTRQESSIETELNVRVELETTKRELDGKVDAIKDSIAAIGRQMLDRENTLSVPTQYGSVIVRHVHEFPSAPPMTLQQKTSLAASRLWDIARQVVFWAAIAIVLSIAATMFANNETLPQAAQTLYSSTLGLIA